MSLARGGGSPRTRKLEEMKATAERDALMEEAEASPQLCAAAFPSCVRSILTEIYLCHACSRHEILSGNAAVGG
eukprot:SAG25_NODE_117_length_14819_cov_20.935670_11_plen_74_part_00